MLSPEERYPRVYCASYMVGGEAGPANLRCRTHASELLLREAELRSAMNKLFQHFAEKVAYFAGTSWAFILAVALLVSWGMSGPLFGFSEQWQLVVNSFTTIVTF